MTTIILTTVFFFTSVYFCIKYFNIRKKVNKVLSELDKPLRKGYYTMDMNVSNNFGKNEDFKSIVYVNELERYTNGQSKIEIYKIETGVSNEVVPSVKVKQFINEQFKSIIKTSIVEWLEVEPDIKKERKEKLDQLKNHLKIK